MTGRRRAALAWLAGAPLQNTTAYLASPVRLPPGEAAQALLRALGGADARATYSAAGIAPTP